MARPFLKRPSGKPLPLVLAATKSAPSAGGAAQVELVVKQPEATSLYNRTANQPGAALEPLLPAADGGGASSSSAAAAGEDGGTSGAAAASEE